MLCPDAAPRKDSWSPVQPDRQLAARKAMLYTIPERGMTLFLHPRLPEAKEKTVLDKLRALASSRRNRRRIAACCAVASLLIIALGLLVPKRPCQRAPKDWPSHLRKKEFRIFSQNGEDGIIAEIFNRIGTTNQYYVEFGTENGAECNTRLLRERGKWRGLLMDGGNEDPRIGLEKEFITPDNINDLFDKYHVPAQFDMLSIDVNFDDWHVWRAISERFQPRVVVIEYNAAIPIDERRVIDPTDTLRWPTAVGTTNYWGASLRAMRDLGRLKGYTLVACDKNGVNAFFVRSDILECQGAQAPPLEALYVHNPFPHYVHETNASRVWLLLDEQCEVVKRVASPQMMLHNLEMAPLASPLVR